jgi:hypothetical protein
MRRWVAVDQNRFSLRQRIELVTSVIGAAFSGSGRITPSSALADLLGGLPRFQLSEGMADRRVRQQNAALF